MAIQMRRGQQVNFNPSLLEPGEFAVSLDTKRVYACFTKGVVLQLATADNLDELIRAVEEYADDAETAADHAEDYADQSKSYAVGTNGTKRPGDATDNSKYYYEQVVDIVDTTFPQFSVDFTTGELMYDRATIYTFGIDYSTGDLAVTMPS